MCENVVELRSVSSRTSWCSKITIKEQWRAKLLLEPIDDNIVLGRWGSCQYYGATNFFDTFMRIRQDLSFQDTLDVLGCAVSWSRIRTFSYVRKTLLREFLNDAASSVRDMFYNKNLDDMWWLQSRLDLALAVCKAVNYDDLFSVLRDASWDLWSAAEFLCNLVFEEFKVEAPKAEGHGPLLNVMVQEGNFRTGLQCALFVENDLVRVEGSFAGFDT